MAAATPAMTQMARNDSFPCIVIMCRRTYEWISSQSQSTKRNGRIWDDLGTVLVDEIAGQ